MRTHHLRIVGVILLILLLPTCSESARIGRPSPIERLLPKLEEQDQLASLLMGVAEDVERHDWTSLIERASPAHYNAQVEGMGMEHPQYAAELMGLHSVGNSITLGDLVRYSDLDRIVHIRFTGMETEHGWIVIKGEAFLSDSTVLRIQIDVAKEGAKLVLTGAVG